MVSSSYEGGEYLTVTSFIRLLFTWWLAEDFYLEIRYALRNVLAGEKSGKLKSRRHFVLGLEVRVGVITREMN